MSPGTNRHGSSVAFAVLLLSNALCRAVPVALPGWPEDHQLDIARTVTRGPMAVPVAARDSGMPWKVITSPMEPNRVSRIEITVPEHRPSA